MAAGYDLLATVDPNAVYACSTGENSGIEDRIASLAGGRRTGAVERDEISRFTGLDTGRCAKRGRASGDCAIEQVAAVGAAGRRQHVVLLLSKTLGVFELTQLVRNADQHIRIGADSQSAFAVEKERRWKDPAPEVRLGDWTEACHSPARRHASCLVLFHVRCVDHAPASVNSGVVEKPFDGPCTRPCDAVLDVAYLLGDVAMDRAVGRKLGNGLQFSRRPARSHAGQRPPQLLASTGRPFGSPPEAVQSHQGRW